MGPRPSGTVTFIFSDIEGSTRLWEQHGDLMRAALRAHDDILRGVLASHQGFIFAVGGDGFAAAFQRASDAVAAAVAAQQTLAAAAWPDGVVMRVRIGLHTGEADERDGNYYGTAVNLAARVMAAAHGGQIVMSGATAELLDTRPGIDVVDLGSHHLRGLAEPVRIFGVGKPGSEWVDRSLNSVDSGRGNLPRPMTEWFGTIATIREVAAELSAHRLITLTGPGGVGKTRLAIEAASAVSNEFDDGVWFVDLAPVADPSSVAAVVGSTFGVRQQSDRDMIGSVVDWLRGRRLLLLLDNCEHLLRPVVQFVAAVLGDVANICVLTTSREPLSLPGERVVQVASLPNDQAVALFNERASATGLRVTPGEIDIRAVDQICARLDGIPLAIELAAARSRSLAPSEMLARLDDRFRLLRGAGRGGLERQQTLRATVAWSYRLLDEAEQLLFDRLSVFAGGCDLTAAEEVCGDDVVEAADVMDLIASLVDKSMVVAERAGPTTRYRLLETLRQYGEERLSDRDETAPVRGRHLEHFAQLATRAAIEFCGPGEGRAGQWFAREWSNIRAAHTWALAVDDLVRAEQLVEAVYRPALGALRFEVIEWGERTIACDPSGTRLHVPVFGATADLLGVIGERERAISTAVRGIGLAPIATDVATWTCWNTLSINLLASGRREEARRAAERLAVAVDDGSDALGSLWSRCRLVDTSLTGERGTLINEITALAQTVGAPSALAVATAYRVSPDLLTETDKPHAEDVVTELRAGIGLAANVGDRMVGSILELGLIQAVVHTRSTTATAVCRSALAELYDTRFWMLIWLALDLVVEHFDVVGDRETASVVVGHLDAHHPVWGQPAGDRRTSLLSSFRDDDVATRWLADGATMSRDEVVALALARLEALG